VKILAIILALQDPGVDLPVQETTLDNGMRILVVPRREAPRVFCSLWWRVGSANERPGLTGLSHFFEHMMFMGTETIGTTDAKKDAELNAKIEAVMARVRGVKLRRLEARRRGRPSDPGDEALYGELWKEYQGLVEEQKKIAIPEHLSKIYQAAGGTGLNASTSFDRTNYFVELPSNKLELFFWLESDRFLAPVFRSFYSEREVVKEERRMRTESTPTGLINESYWSTFWQAHPYRWPVLGWMSDIDQYTVADAEEYYRAHYSPENGTAVFVGDLDPAEVIGFAGKYFGRLKRFPRPPPPIVTVEPDPPAERRVTAEADARDQVQVRWHGPSGVHADSAACDLLMAVFAGRSGRFYRPLVEERKLALGADGGYWSLRHGGVMHVGATPRPGTAPEEVEKALLGIVEEVRQGGVTDRELEKVRNQQMAELVRGLKTYGGIAQQLGYFETVGTWRDLFGYLKFLQAVTGADVKRCAEKYLRPEGRIILTIKRKGKNP
jgi:predicted Zn-dependent peptidase